MNVEHQQGSSRFEVSTPHGTAYLSYERSPDGKALDLQHTIVPEEAQGDGVGNALVQAAIDYARDNRLRVIPTCPFVAAWLKRHPDESRAVRGS